MHEILDRLLWRESVKSGELDNPWDGSAMHWIICMSLNGEFSLGWTTEYKRQGICYFPTEKSAKNAIDSIVKPYLAKHPDFVW